MVCDLEVVPRAAAIGQSDGRSAFPAQAAARALEELDAVWGDLYLTDFSRRHDYWQHTHHGFCASRRGVVGRLLFAVDADELARKMAADSGVTR